jgi:hypothetical protein
VNAGGSLIEALSSEEFYTEFNYFKLEQGEASEVGLAQFDYHYMNRTWRWEYGADYWNSMVHQYVPAFLLGREVKENLKIDSLMQRLHLGQEEIASSLGSTRTGFADSYRSFGVLGVLVFGAIGYIFGRLYAISAAGGLAGQYYYLVLLAEGLKSITHSTAEFASALPFVIVISSVALRFAQVPPTGQRREADHHIYLQKKGPNCTRQHGRAKRLPASRVV